MMNPKFDTYVAVFVTKDSEHVVKFVTSAQGSWAEWRTGEPAKPFAESYARDIVYGLTLNGHAAAVIKVVHGLELRN